MAILFLITRRRWDEPLSPLPSAGTDASSPGPAAAGFRVALRSGAVCCRS
jgi:hypothetical protein